MKVLLIDNHRDRNCWGANPIRRELGRAAVLNACSLELHTRRGPEGDAPPAAMATQFYDGLVLSGSATSCMDRSPWVETQLELIRAFLQHGRPLLGICFGHQLLARAVWGIQVCRKSAHPEKGYITLNATPKAQLLPADPLLGGLGRSFTSYVSHGEEIHLDSTQAVPLLSSQDCANHAFRVPEKRAWGVQFHPEKSPADLIDETGVNPVRLREQSPVYDSQVALRLFGAFLREVGTQ